MQCVQSYSFSFLSVCRSFVPSLIRPFLVAESAKATSAECGGDDCSLLGRPAARDPLAAVRADQANGRRLSPQWRGRAAAEAAEGICRTKRQLGKLTTQLTKRTNANEAREQFEEFALQRTLILSAIVLFAGRHLLFPDDAKTAHDACYLCISSPLANSTPNTLDNGHCFLSLASPLTHSANYPPFSYSQTS